METGECRVETGEWNVETGDWRVESGDSILSYNKLKSVMHGSYNGTTVQRYNGTLDLCGMYVIFLFLAVTLWNVTMDYCNLQMLQMKMFSALWIDIKPIHYNMPYLVLILVLNLLSSRVTPNFVSALDLCRIIYNNKILI